jgi:hypothetical protein
VSCRATAQPAANRGEAGPPRAFQPRPPLPGAGRHSLPAAATVAWCRPSPNGASADWSALTASTASGWLVLIKVALILSSYSVRQDVHKIELERQPEQFTQEVRRGSTLQLRQLAIRRGLRQWVALASEHHRHPWAEEFRASHAHPFGWYAGRRYKRYAE